MYYRAAYKEPCGVVEASTFAPNQIDSRTLKDGYDHLNGHENPVSAGSSIEVDQGSGTYYKDSPVDHQRNKSPDSDSKRFTLAAEEAPIASQDRTLGYADGDSPADF